MKLLLPLLILLAATVSAQERFTKRVVSESSAWAAWETKDFTRLEETDATNGVKLVLPTDASHADIAASLVIALGIVLPPPVCETEEPDRDDLRRFIRVPSEQMCRKR